MANDMESVNGITLYNWKLYTHHDHVKYMHGKTVERIYANKITGLP